MSQQHAAAKLYWQPEYTKLRVLLWHKSTLVVPKYFPQILVTLKIKNLATRNCVYDWGKLAPRQG